MHSQRFKLFNFTQEAPQWQVRVETHVPATMKLPGQRNSVMERRTLMTASTMVTDGAKWHLVMMSKDWRRIVWSMMATSQWREACDRQSFGRFLKVWETTAENAASLAGNPERPRQQLWLKMLSTTPSAINSCDLPPNIGGFEAGSPFERASSLGIGAGQFPSLAPPPCDCWGVWRVCLMFVQCWAIRIRFQQIRLSWLHCDCWHNWIMHALLPPKLSIEKSLSHQQLFGQNSTQLEMKFQGKYQQRCLGSQMHIHI